MGGGPVTRRARRHPYGRARPPRGRSPAPPGRSGGHGAGPHEIAARRRAASRPGRRERALDPVAVAESSRTSRPLPDALAAAHDDGIVRVRQRDVGGVLVRPDPSLGGDVVVERRVPVEMVLGDVQPASRRGDGTTRSAQLEEETSATATAAWPAVTVAISGEPMLPEASRARPEATSIAVTRSVTVVLPFVPVTATTGMGEIRQASSISETSRSAATSENTGCARRNAGRDDDELAAPHRGGELVGVRRRDEFDAELVRRRIPCRGRRVLDRHDLDAHRPEGRAPTAWPVTAKPITATGARGRPVRPAWSPLTAAPARRGSRRRRCRARAP